VPYLTPDEVPEGTACRPLFIPDDSAWLALVSGILSEGAKYWNWQQYGTLTPQECAAVIQDIVDQFYSADCAEPLLPGGGLVVRLDLDGHAEVLQGETWQPPTGDYVVPPPDARTEPTEDEKRCLAAANACEVLKNLYEETVDIAGEAIDTFEFAAGLAIAIATILVPPVGLISASIMALTLITTELVFDTAQFILADVWTSEFDEELICILYNNATVQGDDTVTFDFNKVRNDITNALAFDLDFSLFQQRLALQVGAELGFIGADGLNLAGGTTAITDYDCTVCFGPWIYRWDFGFSDGDWFVRAAGEGAYSPGVGWIMASIGDSNRCVIQYNTPNLSTTPILEMRSRINYNAGSTGLQQIVMRTFDQANGGGSVLHSYSLVDPPDGINLPEIVASQEPASLEMNVWTSSDGVSGDATIEWVEVEGDGERPDFTGGSYL